MVSKVTRIDLPAFSSDSILQSDHGHHPCCFVAGPENRIAIPILNRLLAGPSVHSSTLLQPLVLTGPSGVGKSFLVQAISRKWVSLLGSDCAKYYTAVDFGRELRDARNDGTLVAFTKEILKLRLFILEDLHRLPNSSFVHRQLRELIDSLSESEECVLLMTSQQPPGVDSKLELGLRDRLSAGLLLQIRQPGHQAKVDLLDLTAYSRGLQLDYETVENLALQTEGTAPHMFQALSEYQLRQNSNNPGMPVSKEEVNSESDLKQIVAVVARYFSLTQAAIRSNARRKSLVYARGIAIYLARNLTKLSYAQIGRYLGNRDHTTIMHAHTKTENLLAQETETQLTVSELRRILTAP